MGRPLVIKMSNYVLLLCVFFSFACTRSKVCCVYAFIIVVVLCCFKWVLLTSRCDCVAVRNTSAGRCERSSLSCYMYTVCVTFLSFRSVYVTLTHSSRYSSSFFSLLFPSFFFVFSSRSRQRFGWCFSCAVKCLVLLLLHRTFLGIMSYGKCWIKSHTLIFFPMTIFNLSMTKLLFYMWFLFVLSLYFNFMCYFVRFINVYVNCLCKLSRPMLNFKISL